MMSTGGDGSGDDGLDGRKGGKRELSNSKRAAQNRAAQVRLVSLVLPFPLFWMRETMDAIGMMFSMAR